MVNSWLLVLNWPPLLLDVHMLIPHELMVRCLIVTVRNAKGLLFASSMAVELWVLDRLVTTLIV